MPSSGNKVYLTFDDGPHPEITGFVLDILKEYNAKASFFCIGDNVLKYPGIYSRIVEEGHATGNHTQHHLNGWKTKSEEYINDIREAQEIIPTQLFRPPYGRIRYSQLQMVQQQLKLKPIMWSLLSGDFDQTVSAEKCAEIVVKNMRPGDIIVFHDSEKAFERMKYALPLVLTYIKERGWVAEKLH